MNTYFQKYRVKINLIIIICIFTLIIGSFSSLHTIASDFTRATCIHKNHRTTSEQVREWTNSPYSNCYSLIEYTYHTCDNCGATWTTKTNIQTETHEWQETSRSTKKSYSYNVSGSCYTSTDTIALTCSKCRVSKTETQTGNAVLHVWHDVFDHYDGTYSYIKTQCQTCSIVANTRRIEGYVEIGLYHINKEEK